MMSVCPRCAHFFDAKCETCARRIIIGTLVEMILQYGDMIPKLDALDVIAELLGERVRARIRHNKALREEQREASRSAREAYVEGRSEGERSRGEW